MEKRHTIVFGGAWGQRYRFQVWPLEARFRPVGGVFMVTRRAFNNATFRRASHEVLYIGETSDLSGSLWSVSRLDGFRKQGANCVCVFPTEDPAQRESMVAALTEQHGPLIAA